MDRTIELLETLDADTQARAVALVIAARRAGIPLVLISALRSPEGNRDVNGSSRSYHLSGQAFDVQVYGYLRDQIPYWWWEQLGTWAEENTGLFWGGRVNWLGRPDVNHFDNRLWTAGLPTF